jgi:hypothetical protein
MPTYCVSVMLFLCISLKISAHVFQMLLTCAPCPRVFLVSHCLFHPSLVILSGNGYFLFVQLI